VSEHRRTYAGSGVSIEANEEAVGLIAKGIADAGATRPEVIDDIGGFAAAFSARFPGMVDPILISATDGVGTKLTIAQTMDRHDTVGFDLVAMVVDDIVCAGAEPLFLLDYIACGRNVPARTAEIVGGIARACSSVGCALLGGETAEHPGIMDPDEYDLAAFGVGVVERDRMLGPARVRAGDTVIGLASSGLHSNGYSLVRTLILDLDLTLDAPVPGSDRPLGEWLLTPCRIHAPAVLAAVAAAEVHAAAHVTQGGIAGNLARVLPADLGARLDRSSWSEHAIFSFLQEAGALSEEEMDRVFNRGIGMVVIVAAGAADAAVRALADAGETATVIGEIVPGDGVEIT
jgi:phosphoribosylformylglycinamidine cyclo-ligase